ncbi:hypothetical protein QBZ16_003280 [Prototheca wickerhamii]|uniref:SWIM-type domain-containing protein n=1 Tax=Prototheca wickerhamii TaxID=3111 RepID=A0AAD9IKQ1_PROWI|nr:hypothetical protein QBZ16_003280 [Prototheca wickerhamii]
MAMIVRSEECQWHLVAFGLAANDDAATIQAWLEGQRVRQLWRLEYHRAKVDREELDAALTRLMDTPSFKGNDLDAQEREAIEAIEETWVSLNTAPFWNEGFRQRWIKGFPPRMWLTALQAGAQSDAARAAYRDAARRDQMMEGLANAADFVSRVDLLAVVLGRYAAYVAEVDKLGHFKRCPSRAGRAGVLRAIKAAEDIPESHVHAPERGERHWLPNGKPCRVDPADALGCTCPQAGRGKVCKHIIKVLKIKEPGLTDELIVLHLGVAWGSLEGTVDAMLRAMRSLEEPLAPAPRPGAALAAAAAVELPARSPKQEQEEESLLEEEEDLEHEELSKSEPHSMDPPEYNELVRALVRLRRTYGSFQAAAYEADLEQLRTWFYAHHTSDGTLVHVKSKARFAVDADDWKFFNKHVPSKIQELVEDGFQIVIFSYVGGIKSALQGAGSNKTRARVDNVVKALAGKGDAVPVQFAEKAGIAFKTPEDVFGEGEAKKEVVFEGSSGKNDKLADAFQELTDHFRKLGDAFKANAFAKVQKILAGWPTPIASSKDLKGVAGVGKGSAAKIDEFLETGKFAVLEEAGDGAAVPKSKATEEAAPFLSL